MTMRSLWVVAALALTACGNYSNDDVEFLSAIPSREQLSSKYAASNGTAAARAGVAAQALAVGEASELATDTEAASNGFNSFLYQILDLLDAVTKITPTERHPDERIWGPYPDDKHPGWEVRMVMDRTGTQFNYHVDVRRVGTDAWLQILKGDFHATGGLRKGTGGMHLLVAQAIAGGYSNPGDNAAIEALDATYHTDVPPIGVTLTVSEVGQSVPVVDYTYSENADSSGQMRFTIVDPNSQLGLDVLSRWTSTGLGRADAAVTSGSQVGATWVECWSASSTVLYSNQSWAPPPVGDAAQCAFAAPGA